MAASSSKRRAFGGIRQLPSKRHQAYYTGPDGRRHTGWSTYLYRGDAESWLRDEEVLIDRGTWTPPARRKPIEIADAVTVAEYAEACIRRRERRARKPLRASTADLYRKLLRLAINPTLGRVAIVDLTPAIVSSWYDSLPGDQPTQNGNAYQLLRSILADAVDDEIIDRSPCRVKGAGKPQPKHVAEALSPGELVVYLAHVRERYRVPLMLAAWCGLRSGEVRALRRMDVSDDGTVMRVERTVTRLDRQWHYGPPKTAAGRRTVAIPPHLAGVVVAYIESRTDPDALLFPAYDGVHPISTGTFHEAHKVAAKAIGRPTLTVHDLRRTGATLAAQSGATVKEVMRMLGHTQPGVAMVYQVADATRDMERARRMSALAIES